MHAVIWLARESQTFPYHRWYLCKMNIQMVPIMQTTLLYLQNGGSNVETKGVCEDNF
jgi:hypothetical protein